MPIKSITVTDSGYTGNDLGVSLAASDDVSGISSFYISWIGPNNKLFRVVKSGISEIILSGVFSQATNSYSSWPTYLDKYSPSGTYVLSNISITDQAGNNKYYGSEALTAAGLNINDYSLNVLNTVPTYSLSASSIVNQGY